MIYISCKVSNDCSDRWGHVKKETASHGGPRSLEELEQLSLIARRNGGRPRPRGTPWQRGLLGRALRLPQLASHGQREANGCLDAQATSRASKPSKVGWMRLRTRDARLSGEIDFRHSWLLHVKKRQECTVMT